MCALLCGCGGEGIVSVYHLLSQLIYSDTLLMAHIPGFN